MTGETFSAERMAEVYLTYLYKNRANDRHVRRVASWLGLLVLGIERIKDRWWVSHKRQLCFEAQGCRFKVKFEHHPRPGGGIHLIQIETGRGQREIGQAIVITSLTEAERFYRKPRLPKSK